MENKKLHLKYELFSCQEEFDLAEIIICSQKENAKYAEMLKNGETLPENVYRCVNEDNMSETSFLKIVKTDLTESEMNEYLNLKKLSMIKTIKNCVVFFTVLTAFFLFISVLSAASTCGAISSLF